MPYKLHVYLKRGREDPEKIGTILNNSKGMPDSRLFKKVKGLLKQNGNTDISSEITEENITIEGKYNIIVEVAWHEKNALMIYKLFLLFLFLILVPYNAISCYPIFSFQNLIQFLIE